MIAPIRHFGNGKYNIAIPLAVLWDFKGLQGKKTNKIPFQIFSSRQPPRRLEQPARRGEG